MPMSIHMRALLVHLFTATGAVFAMLAMLAAVDGKWDLMFPQQQLYLSYKLYIQIYYNRVIEITY